MRRKFSIIAVIIAAVLLGLFGSGFAWYTWHSKAAANNLTLPKGDTVIDDIPGLENRVSVLLIGADQRPGDERYNTDSLILATVDPESKRITLLSIPRDTRVQLEGHGYVKINAIAALKDLATLQQTVSDLTGLPIKGYVQTNFDGFKQIIDTLGGVTIDVEKNMYFKTGDKKDGIINLHKGVQKLDGAKALQYARFRHDALADISRTARQQVVLKAVAKEMLQVSTIPKLPKLIPQLMEAVHTNLALGDIMKLSKVVVNFDSSNVISQTLPGGFLDVDGLSYWDVDPEEAKVVVSNLLQGITTDKVVNHQTIDLLSPVITKQNKPIPKVPGNEKDPNGEKSTGFRTVPPKPVQKVPGNSEDPNGEGSTGYEQFEKNN